MPEPMEFFLDSLLEGLNIKTGEVSLPLFGLAGTLILMGGFQVLQLLSSARERLFFPSNSINSVFEIDPGRTNITRKDDGNLETNRARVTFFILGASES